MLAVKRVLFGIKLVLILKSHQSQNTRRKGNVDCCLTREMTLNYKTELSATFGNRREPSLESVSVPYLLILIDLLFLLHLRVLEC